MSFSQQEIASDASSIAQSPQAVQQEQPKSVMMGTRGTKFAPTVKEIISTNREGEVVYNYDVYHFINGMKAYEEKSFDELRLEDEEAGLENPPKPEAVVNLFDPDPYGFGPQFAIGAMKGLPGIISESSSTVASVDPHRLPAAADSSSAGAASGDAPNPQVTTSSLCRPILFGLTAPKISEFEYTGAPIKIGGLSLREAILASSYNRSPGSTFPLYKDLLQVVLQHLTAPELHRAAQLSRQWYDVLKHMKPMGLEMTLFPSRPLFLFQPTSDIPPHSAVARHIGLASNLEFLSHAKPNILCEIASSLPNLSSMKVVGNVREWEFPKLGEEVKEILLPQQLLTFEAAFQLNQELDYVRAFATIASLPLLQNLGLLLYCHEFPFLEKEIDFSPFIDRVPQLNSLRVHFTVSEAADQLEIEPLSRSLVKLLRQSSLTRLYLCCETTSRFFSFGSVPVPSRRITLTHMLERLNLDATPYPLIQSLTSIETRDLKLNLPLMKMLLKFPSLNKIEVSLLELEPANLSLLAQLPHLTHLKFESQPIASAKTDPSILAIACQHCPRVQKLEIINQHDVTTEALNECLAPLTQLTHLTLAGCSSIQNMTFLKQHDLSRRLQHLSLASFDLTPAVVTECILPLQELRFLEIRHCLTEQPPELMAKLSCFSRECAFPLLRQSILKHL